MKIALLCVLAAGCAMAAPPTYKVVSKIKIGGGVRWDVKMTKVAVDGSELLVCAVGGTPAQRKKQIARGAAGALRILQA